MQGFGEDYIGAAAIRHRRVTVEQLLCPLGATLLCGKLRRVRVDSFMSDL